MLPPADMLMILKALSRSNSRPLDFSCSEASKSLVERARVGEVGVPGTRGAAVEPAAGWENLEGADFDV